MTDNTTQAAANKAAEEGLHNLLESLLRPYGVFDVAIVNAHADNQLDFFSLKDQVRAFIAADRASRQVANKAEVEPGPVCTVPPDGWRCTRQPGHEGPCAAVSADDTERFSEVEEAIYQRGIEDGKSIESGMVRLRAGAAPVTHLRWWARQINEGHGNIGHEEGYEVCSPDELSDDGSAAFPVYAAHPVTTGSITVLTDERIAAVFKELGVAGAPMPNTYKFARAIEREVAAQAGQVAVPFDFHAHLARQAAWSAYTFGPGPRTKGVCDHIRKELLEIESDPLDLREWIDVVILGLDGAWRCGGTPEQIIAGIVAKQAKNEGRTWPDWRTADPDKAIEHDRSGE